MQTKMIVAALLFAASPSAVLAAESSPLTPLAITGTSYTQNFDTLSSTSTSNVLPTGWQIVENGTSSAVDGSYAVSNGSNNAGGAYSFGAIGSTDRALGSIGSGTNAPVLFGGLFINDLGATITEIAFSYIGEQWRVGTSGLSDGLTFSYALNATSIGDDAASWVNLNLLDFMPLIGTGNRALDGNVESTAISAIINGLTIANGDSFAFRWTDRDAIGSDHGLGVDNVALSFTTATTGAVPEPATWAMMIAGFGLAGAAMRRRRSAISFA